jgi:glyoxylase-like metal-dependent hydrolase (beta-lactamase superfamily II)
MGFLTEPEPPRGVATEVLPGISRMVAANPGPMTYWGTNTYLLDGPDGTWVLDPGPADPAHVAAILAATPRVARIVITHHHADHVGALPMLIAATGAPVYGPALPPLDLEHKVQDGELCGAWLAVHTPGHAADHLCWEQNDILFSGDQVMSWNSSVVVDVAAYIASLRRMLERPAKLYLPGHGPALPDPHRLVRHLLGHRLQREAAVVRALEDGPKTIDQLVARLYPDLDTKLHGAAARSVAAHLEKLAQESRATDDGETWRKA